MKGPMLMQFEGNPSDGFNICFTLDVTPHPDVFVWLGRVISCLPPSVRVLSTLHQRNTRAVYFVVQTKSRNVVITCCVETQLLHQNV